MNDTQPPNVDLDLERQVLGQVLAHPSVYGLFVGSQLASADFFRHAHRWIWEAIDAVSERGESPDLLAVRGELTQRNQLEEVGLSYLARLTDGMPKPAEPNVLTAVCRLHELAARRLVALASRTLAGEVETHPDSLSDGTVTHRLEQIETALTERLSGPPRVLDVFGQVGAYLSDVHTDDAPRIVLGFPALDAILGGIRPGEVCGLMARPGVGKTNVICQIVRHVAEARIGHVCFSLEMPAAQITERILRGFYGLGRDELSYAARRQRMDWEPYHGALSDFALVDLPGLSVAQMAGFLRQAQLTMLAHTKVRLVTVDHLGLIGGDRRMSTYDRVSTQARELKEFAKRHGVAVFLAIQVNRESGGDGSRELGLGAARDSGVVEEAMDYLIAMRRLDRSTALSPGERAKYRDVLFMKVVKHRHGDPGDELAFRLNTRTMCFSEAPDIQTGNDISRVVEAAGGRRR